MGCCQACGRIAPTRRVEINQNIGMLVVRTSRSIRGELCKRCIKKYAIQMTLLTMLTGWWGAISFILNIVYIITNTVTFFTALAMADSGGQPGYPQTNMSAGRGNTVRAPQQSRPTGKSAGQPAAQHPLAPYRQDIRLRLKSGETPEQVAAFIGPRAGVNVEVAQRYAESLVGT